MYLRRVWSGVNLFSNGRKRSSNEICGAFVAHSKHHGGSNIKDVPFSCEVRSAASWNEIPAFSARVAFFCIYTARLLYCYVRHWPVCALEYRLHSCSLPLHVSSRLNCPAGIAVHGIRLGILLQDHYFGTLCGQLSCSCQATHASTNHDGVVDQVCPQRG